MKKGIAAILAVIIAIAGVGVNAKSENLPYYEEIPEYIRDICEDCQEEFGISQYYLLGIIYKECRFKADVVNGNVTQVTSLSYFKEGIEALKLDKPKTDVRQNIRLCSYYLAKWAEEYPEEPYLWSRLWNEGTSALSNKERTTEYSRQVIDMAYDWETWDSQDNG